jgi:acetyltransferase-like isoleucine patch superfamily enzyme
MEAVLPMQSMSSAADAPHRGALEAVELPVVEKARLAGSSAAEEGPLAESTPPRVGDRIMPRRLGLEAVLNYLTNHVVTHVPSFTFRHLWYRVVLGIRIGNNAAVFMGTYVWFDGPRTTRRAGVRIGRNSKINRKCTLDVRNGLTIGNNVSISPEVMVLGATDDVNDAGCGAVPGPVRIDDYAFIGTRAVIFPGVTVGRGAVIAAGSLVSKDVPPMTIVAGAPARPIGMRDPGATAYELGPSPLFE